MEAKRLFRANRVDGSSNAARRHRGNSFLPRPLRSFFVKKCTSPCRRPVVAAGRAERRSREQKDARGEKEMGSNGRGAEDDGEKRGRGERKVERWERRRTDGFGHDVLFDSIKSVGFEAAAPPVGYTRSQAAALCRVATGRDAAA